MKSWTIILGVFFLLVGCSTTSVSVDQPPTSSAMLADYKIGVGDSLAIKVWKSPELSVLVPVRPDGRISVPLVGDVMAYGITPEALSSSLRVELEKFVRNAQVTVVVSGANSSAYLRRVRATGAVSRPVSVQYHQGMSVLDLVLEAGGVTEFAKANKSKLYRQTDGEMMIYPVFINDILEKGKLDTNYLLSPSDILTVPERTF